MPDTSVHQSGPRRLPRLVCRPRPPRRSSCPSIRAASASATTGHLFPSACNPQVSINQGRVGFRDHTCSGAATANASVHQSGPRRLPRPPSPPPSAPPLGCPSIRAASASATAGGHRRRQARQVSINQGRVGFRDSRPASVQALPLECPSIRAASASATRSKDRPWPGSTSVHQSGPRRLPRRSLGRWEWEYRYRVHQSGPRRLPRPGTCEAAPTPCSVHQSGPRRLPRLYRVGLSLSSDKCPSIRAASASATIVLSPLLVPVTSVHQSGPRRLPRPRSWTPTTSDRCVHQSGPRRLPRPPHRGVGAGRRAVSINQGRVGFRDASTRQRSPGSLSCPSIRAASASATLT